MKSLKTKFASVITLLIIAVIAATSTVLVLQKKSEIETDIYTNLRSFGELTAHDIVGIADLYLEEESFVFFNRDLTEILKRNSDTLGVKIYSYAGQTLYDYETEVQKQYVGPNREIDDPETLNRIKSANASIKLTDGQIIYLEKVEAGVYNLVDQNGTPIQKELTHIQNFVFPVQNEYAVLYDVTYQNLNERLLQSAKNIGLIGLIGLLISIIFGSFLAGVVTRPLNKLTEAVKVIAKGDFKKRVDVKSNDEVGLLSDSVNSMAKDLDKATKAKIEHEKVKKELEIAGQIQQDLLPKQIPQIKGIDIAAEVIPATEVGGDVYDILQDSKGETYLYVGDVTGHGVPAGLLSAVTNAILSSTIDLQDLEKIVNNLNAVLRRKTAKNLFLTMVLLKVTSSKIEYVNAGHEQLIHFNAKTKKAKITDPGGIALSMLDDVSKQIKSESLKLAKDDVIVLYTDGVPEAWKNSKEQYGSNRLHRAIEKFAPLKSASDIKKALIKDIKSFTGSYEQKDDITLIVIKKS